MRQQEAAGAGGPVGVERLVDAQVTPWLAVRSARLQGRLADEQIGVAGELGDPLTRSRVTGVRERGGCVRDAKAVGLEPVVRQPHGKDAQAGGRELRLPVVLRHLERAVEHVGEAQARAELLEVRPSAAIDPQLGLLVTVAAPVEAPPDPGHEVAPVVEVEVRDRDRVESGPCFPLAQPAKHAGAAIEQQPLAARRHEVPGVCAAGVRPGRGRPDDGEAHLPILTAWRGRFEW
jgi:hypothetical protein